MNVHLPGRWLLSSSAALAMVLVTGCSLVVKFDDENRPCGEDADRDGNGDCLDGYSCMINVCVRDRSVSVGETCSVNDHCVRGAICTTAPFVCRDACENPFGARDCGAGAGCAPMTDATGAMVGACREKECSSTCAEASEVCVLAKSDIGFCLDGCTVTCPGGVCRGNCSFGPESQARECSVVGQNRVLACLPQGLRPHGSGCDLESLHCVQGTSCVLTADGSFGVCLQYCDPTAATPCGTLLDPATGALATCQQLPGQAFGLCGSLPATSPGDDGAPGGDPGGGDPGPPPAAACTERCGTGTDCIPGYKCVSNRCRPCSVAADCVPHASLWQGVDTNADSWGDTPCTADAECSGGFCVSYQSQGFCAGQPFGFCLAGGVEATVDKVEGGTTTVCRNDTAVCDQNVCDFPCDNDPGCWGQFGITCTSDTDCSLLTNYICIGVGGGHGRCFVDATAAGSCTLPDVQVGATHIDGSTPKQICATTSYTCDLTSHRCVYSGPTYTCPGDFTCSGDTPDCESGQCVCNASSCTSDPAHPTCDTTTGQCECAVATTCEGLVHRNLGTTWVCE